MSQFARRSNDVKDRLLSISVRMCLAMSSMAVLLPAQATPEALKYAAGLNRVDTVTVSAVSTPPSPSTAAISEQQKQSITHILREAGMSAPIESIKLSELPSMYQVNVVQSPFLEKIPPLHISKDGRYILQGELLENPSPKKSSPPQQTFTKSMIGMPVSDEIKATMLANSSLLKNMQPDTAFYYTAVPNVIWGITTAGQPFITNTEASVFTDGEISVIKNGQFAGLDAEFEQRKNHHILQELDEEQLIIYPATTEEKAVIYVANDINCPYCRVMHQDMARLNDKGVTVKLIGYPYFDGSAEQMRQIWCETNKNQRRLAFDKAMNGQAITPQCDTSSVNRLHQNFVSAAGLVVFATPAIYREDGVRFDDIYQEATLLEFLGLQP